MPICIANAILTRFRHPNVIWQSYILEALAFVVASILTELNHTRTRRSSTIILLFWPLYLAALAIWIRTSISLSPSSITPEVVLRSTVGLLGLLDFVLECACPEIGLDESEVSENPILRANVFSIWTFSWMTPLLKKGASRFITEDDLPPLVPRDEAAQLAKRLEHALQKQYVPHSTYKSIC